MQEQLLRAKEYVRRHYPDMADAEPTAAQPAPEVTVFTFRKSFTTPDGAKLSMVVRVSIAQDGTIMKAVSAK